MSNILQDIFKDNYERMIYTLHPRKSVIENVDRMGDTLVVPLSPLLVLMYTMAKM